MASIAWTDDGDDFELASPRPTPADRFWEFEPNYAPIGPRRTTVGNRAQNVFLFREDYTAKLAIRHLTGSATQLLALALIKWLIAGGAVTVTTDDGDTAVYTGLTLNPGTTPTFTKEDEQRVHFAFRCELASDDPITVDYSA